MVVNSGNRQNDKAILPVRCNRCITLSIIISSASSRPVSYIDKKAGKGGQPKQQTQWQSHLPVRCNRCITLSIIISSASSRPVS